MLNTHFTCYLLWILLSLHLTLVAGNSFVMKGPARMAKPYSPNNQFSSSQSSSLYAPSNHSFKNNMRLQMSLTDQNIKIRSAPKIIIAGAPAAGKGTQCEVIKENFGVIHLSTGDILRAAVKEGTSLGLQAKAFMDAGQLVPDELIISVVCDRLKQQDCLNNGWLLDGFPRTRKQAEALAKEELIPDSFILLDVPENALVERVSGRRTDPVTGKIYHMKFSPPENDDIAKRLIQRSDDTAEKIVVRYREFQSHIDAIRSFYEDKMILVDGTIPKEEVSNSVISALLYQLSDGETHDDKCIGV